MWYLTFNLFVYFTVLLPQLKSITERNTIVEDLTDRLEVAEELITSFSAALCCCIFFLWENSGCLQLLENLENLENEPLVLEKPWKLVLNLQKKLCRHPETSCVYEFSFISWGWDFMKFRRLPDYFQCLRDIKRERIKDITGTIATFNLLIHFPCSSRGEYKRLWVLSSRSHSIWFTFFYTLYFVVKVLFSYLLWIAL